MTVTTPSIPIPELEARYRALGPIEEMGGERTFLGRCSTFDGFLQYGPSMADMLRDPRINLPALEGEPGLSLGRLRGCSNRLHQINRARFEREALMHYYAFNIADYRKDTQHLTPIEHYIYRTLIDWYYLDEQEIPKKTKLVMRRLGLVSEYLENLENVLADFFEETENGWKNVCASVQEGAVLKKGDEDVIATAHSWHQLMRYLSLELSMNTGTMAQVSLKRAHLNDPDAHLRDTIDEIVGDQALHGSIQVPNTASDIFITAHLTRRVVTLSMKVRANQDVVRPTAGINWLVRQIKSTDETDLILKALWPGRTPSTQAPLGKVLESVEILVPEGQKEVPKEFEVFRVVDLGAKFKGQKVFVELVKASLPKFYDEVGQYLSNWVASPPKPKKSDEREDQTKDFPDEIDRGDDPAEKKADEIEIADEKE